VTRLLSIVLLVFGASAHGAGITFVEPDTIEWSGEFTLGDYDKFIRLAAEHPRFSTLRLVDAGDGNPDVMRWMIWTVRGPGMTAEVQGACSGACALIFLNATNRRFTRPPSPRTHLHLKGAHVGGNGALVDDLRETARLAGEASASTGRKLSLEMAFKAMRVADPRGGLMIYAAPRKGGQVFTCRGNERVKPDDCAPVKGATPASLGIVSTAAP
jgi:hypothetical protein